MKKGIYRLILFVACWLGCLTAGGQSNMDKILDKPQQYIDEFRLENARSAMLLRFDYGSSKLHATAQSEMISAAQVKQIDLYYSDFPKGTVNSDLNRRRLQSLEQIIPGILNEPDIQWNIYSQTKCSNKKEAQSLFHGFVIHVQNNTTSSPDLNYLHQVFDETNDNLYQDIRFNDSTVIDVFNRHADWNQMLIVSDLTGSMAPYMAQLLIWYRLHTNNDLVKQWVFFNDGDLKEDKDKTIGNTGGIYNIATSDFDQVLFKAYETIKNGTGGDAPENDLEALNAGIALCPNCKEVILIADNYSNIRDIALLNAINRPVKIVLCGADKFINPVYLTLARNTGGAVYTIERDIDFLMDINEGEEFSIGKQLYKLENGKMIAIKKG